MNRKLFEKHVRELPEGAAVLDAGCGSGNNSRYLHNIRPDVRITCLDVDASAGRDIPGYAGFVQASVEDLRCLQDDSFDCILCFHVIEHLSNASTAVSEFNRILKKGGLVFAESPHWITSITPVGFNFYDDPSHVRPHNVNSFRRLFGEFDVRYVKFETAIYFFLDELYGHDKYSPAFVLRKLLKALGIYRTAVFLIAEKR